MLDKNNFKIIIIIKQHFPFKCDVFGKLPVCGLKLLILCNMHLTLQDLRRLVEKQNVAE